MAETQANPGVRRKRGGQPGNRNRLRHGGFSAAARARRESVRAVIANAEKFIVRIEMIARARCALKDKQARKALAAKHLSTKRDSGCETCERRQNSQKRQIKPIARRNEYVERQRPNAHRQKKWRLKQNCALLQRQIAIEQSEYHRTHGMAGIESDPGGPHQKASREIDRHRLHLLVECGVARIERAGEERQQQMRRPHREYDRCA